MILWILLVLKYIGCESNLNQCQDENCSIIQQTLRSPGNRSSQYYSEQQVCDLLDAALLFGQTDDLVILTENGHYTKELYTQQCVQRTPHRIWLIPKLIQKEYFENNIKKWLRDGIQKFVILCSLESTSLLLELTKGLLISGLEPLFFITSRQPMYFLGSLPSMVVAVEDGNNENSGDPTEKNFKFYIHDAMYHKWRTINYHDLMHQHYTSLELRDIIESYPLSSFVQENYQLQLRVVTVVEEPYMMIANFSNVFEDGSCVVGKICWKPNNEGPFCCIGYLIDMLESLEEDLMFQSYLYFVADGKYGEIVNGSWVGMVGDLVKGKADLALASLTINTKRSEAVSYSLPFLVGGMILISMLEEKALPFANLEPFKAIALDLWIGVIVVPSCTVLIIVITDRIGAGKQYALRESFTYIMGLLFQRDMGGKNPISWSSKVIALSVAMFTLVVMSTYTALLTANSVTFTRSLGISGFDDPKIKNPTREFRYGTVANSAYTQLFANSQDPVWNRMAQFMKDYNFTNTSKAFEQLATGELQAIIHDYFIAYHNIAKDTNCRFKFAGESIKDGGSGLAVQKGSKLANQISTLILKYQDQEFFLQLQQKWMENKCVETSKGSSPGATNNNNVVVRIGKEYFGGVFIALCGVTLISFGILVAEYLLNRKIHTRTYWVSERRRKRWRRY